MLTSKNVSAGSPLHDLGVRVATARETRDAAFDVICLSHLRWDFVYQRPQHLLSRCALRRRVFFFEEPLYESVSAPQLRVSDRKGVVVAVPILPSSARNRASEILSRLLDQLITQFRIQTYALWFYTPMSISFSSHLKPMAVVYDCMDELSMFKGAPAELSEREKELMRWSDLVFTGGVSLYESKRRAHSRVYAVPSSIDKAHFRRARGAQISEPPDQKTIRHPRLGYCGVLDERLDRELIASVAALRPDWQFILIGPVAKLELSELPQAANLHYLGQKDYQTLPDYIAGWDVALLPFALNDATRFISPTKTPEYLAAGRPVVSTPVADVVRSYGAAGLVEIADRPQEFVAAVERCLTLPTTEWLVRVDEYLAPQSWDATWAQMEGLLVDVVAQRSSTATALAAEGD